MTYVYFLLLNVKDIIYICYKNMLHYTSVL